MLRAARSGVLGRLRVPFVLVVFLVVLFSSSYVAIMESKPVAAANPTATWISNGDPAKMVFNGKIFTQSKITKGEISLMMTLTAPGACKTADDMIDVGLTLSENDPTVWNYHTAKQALTYTFSSDCKDPGRVRTDLTNTFNTLAGPATNNVYTGAWMDSKTVHVFGDASGEYGVVDKLIKVDSTGNTMTLTATVSIENDCARETLKLGDDTNSFMGATTGIITLNRFIENPASKTHGSCQVQRVTVNLVNTQLSVMSVGHWNPDSHDPDAAIIIDRVGADAAEFIHVGDTYLESSKKPIKGNDMTLLFPIFNSSTVSCDGVVDDTMHANPYTTAMYTTITAYFSGDCTKKFIWVGLTNIYGAPTAVTPSTNDNPTTTSDSCNVPNDKPLRWFQCPIISDLQGFASAINGFIGQQLSVPNGIFFNDGTQKVFNIFRNIGVAMLVLAGLIMVVSQAADLELFAAHTVRKALPRLIIVAILISISWPLLQFIIGFFNDIGFWTGKIILSITSYTNVGGGDAGTIMSHVGDLLIAGLAAAGGITLLGAGGVISLIVSFILFVIVGIFVLMIRQVIILLCILLTPLALASFVLPGTEKIGKFWQDTLITTLVMFPLIEGFLAAGTALASIILSVKSGDYGYHILAMLVFLAPYMALPFAFKLAGGLVGRVVDFAQGAHGKTIEGRLQGYRQNTVAKNSKALQAGSRWNPNSRWTNLGGRYNPFNGRTVNFLGRHVGAGARGRFGFGITANQRALSKVAMANNMVLSADAASKMDTNFAAQMNNEEAMAAVAFGNDAKRLRNLKYFSDMTFDKATGRTLGENRLRSALAAGRTIQATQQMQAAAADALVRSGKVLENRDEFSAMVDSIAHGNAAYAGAIDGNFRYTARQIGRADWGRKNDYDALKEMDMAAVARQKPKSLENLFGSNVVTKTAANPTGSAVVDAINGSKDKNERQHFADILFASQYNQSLSPEQQKSIAEAINVLDDPSHPLRSTLGLDLIGQARANYRDKFTPPSDRRLKHDIRLVQTLSNGIKLYSFQYNWGGPHYVGVMAQDILASHPKAVVVGEDGYYRVRYDVLGVEMVTVGEWVKTHSSTSC